MIDLTGERFGRLTVLGLDEERRALLIDAQIGTIELPPFKYTILAMERVAMYDDGEVFLLTLQQELPG